MSKKSQDINKMTKKSHQKMVDKQNQQDKWWKNYTKHQK